MTYQEFAMDVQDVDNLWDCDLDDEITKELWKHCPDNPENIKEPA